jgi:ketosteroid isomerase-like protein
MKMYFPAGSFRPHLERSICMKRILVVAMLVAVCGFVFNQRMSISANQKGNDEQAIRQLLKEISAALERADTAALDRIYADDYTLVDDFGVLTTKAPRLAAIKSGELKFESVSFDDVNIRIYGNTSVATFRVTSKGQLKGKEIGGQSRGTSTYVKMKGRWQLVAAQVTRITE